MSTDRVVPLLLVAAPKLQWLAILQKGRTKQVINARFSCVLPTNMVRLNVVKKKFKRDVYVHILGNYYMEECS